MPHILSKKSVFQKVISNAYYWRRGVLTDFIDSLDLLIRRKKGYLKDFAGFNHMVGGLIDQYGLRKQEVKECMSALCFYLKERKANSGHDGELRFVLEFLTKLDTKQDKLISHSLPVNQNKHKYKHKYTHIQNKSYFSNFPKIITLFLGYQLIFSEASKVKKTEKLCPLKPLQIGSASFDRCSETFILDAMNAFYADPNFYGKTFFDQLDPEARNGNLILNYDLLRRDKEGLTTLDKAILNDDPDMVSYIIEENPKALKNTFHSPLHISAEHGWIDTFKILNKYIPVDTLDKNGHDIVDFAAFNGRVDFLRFLRNEGLLNNHFVRDKGPTAIYHAAVANRKDVFNIFLPKEIDVPINFNGVRAPVSFYAVGGSLNTTEVQVRYLKLILNHGANINSKGSGLSISQSGKSIVMATAISLLHYYASMGNLELARVLLRRGANMDEPAMSTIVRNNDLHMVQLFLDYGYSVKEHTDILTHLAPALGDINPLFQELVKNGADFKGKNKENRSPLEVAIKSKNEQLATLLLNGSGTAVNGDLYFLAKKKGMESVSSLIFTRLPDSDLAKIFESSSENVLANSKVTNASIVWSFIGLVASGFLPILYKFTIAQCRKRKESKEDEEDTVNPEPEQKLMDLKTTVEGEPINTDEKLLIEDKKYDKTEDKKTKDKIETTPKADVEEDVYRQKTSEIKILFKEAKSAVQSLNDNLEVINKILTTKYAVSLKKAAIDEEAIKSDRDKLNNLENNFNDLITRKERKESNMAEILSRLQNISVNIISLKSHLTTNLEVFSKVEKIYRDKIEFNEVAKKPSDPRAEVKAKLDRAKQEREEKKRQEEDEAKRYAQEQAERKQKWRKEQDEKKALEKDQAVKKQGSKHEAADSKSYESSKSNPTRATVSEKQQNFLYFALKNLLCIGHHFSEYKLRQQENSDKAKVEKSIAVLNDVTHYALLYCMSRCFHALTIYKKWGGVTTAALPKEDIDYTRNAIIHAGAIEATKESVIASGELLYNDLPRDLIDRRNARQLHELKLEQSEILKLIKSYGLSTDPERFSIVGGFPLVVEDMPIFQHLVGYHNAKEVAEISDEKLREIVWDKSVPIIRNIMGAISKIEDKEPITQDDINRFVERFLPNLQALKMLFALCGEFRTEATCNKNVDQLKQFRRKLKSLKKEELDGFNFNRLDNSIAFFTFLSKCRTIRNSVAHDFPDDASIHEIYEAWFLLKSLKDTPSLKIPQMSPAAQEIPQVAEVYKQLTWQESIKPAVTAATKSAQLLSKDLSEEKNVSKARSGSRDKFKKALSKNFEFFPQSTIHVQTTGPGEPKIGISDERVPSQSIETSHSTPGPISSDHPTPTTFSVSEKFIEMDEPDSSQKPLR